MNILLDNLIGNYGWWLLALLLIGAEVIAPGYFMLWIGLAAGVMGLVMLFASNLPVLAQALLFAALAIVSCTVYWKYIRPIAERRNDQPLLNKRGAQLVGQRFVLAEAIVNGRGKVQVGDGSWLAIGPDIPAGGEVEVVATEGTAVRVRPVV